MTEAKLKISSIKTLKGFMSGRACSDMLFNILDSQFGHPSDSEERAAMPLAGGIMQNGYQCGMIWGSALAAGARAYRIYGPGPQAQARALIAAQRIVESFREQNKHINCLEITDLDKSSSALKMITFFLIKGGTIGCARMAARFAPLAYELINEAYCEKDVEIPVSPISCSAMLAEKTGASDRHQTLAAGLAGGIGLCGGACGALGAAVWLMALKNLEKGSAKVDFKDPKAGGLVEKFLKATNYEFKCSEITGRKFESIEDHAAYLRDGGCSKVIELLAQA